MAGHDPCKKEVGEAMQEIAKRKPGNSRLVFDKTSKTIIAIDRQGRVNANRTLRLPALSLGGTEET